ncbi:hypothetical protein FOCC_FOCC006529 [Frankliniella occidentalis]|nr:hypothetical protein FOCC_FOCC006529 [Frankliniella occidentalis]
MWLSARVNSDPRLKHGVVVPRCGPCAARSLAGSRASIASCRDPFQHIEPRDLPLHPDYEYECTVCGERATQALPLQPDFPEYSLVLNDPLQLPTSIPQPPTARWPAGSRPNSRPSSRPNSRPSSRPGSRPNSRPSSRASHSPGRHMGARCSSPTLSIASSTTSGGFRKSSHASTGAVFFCTENVYCCDWKALCCRHGRCGAAGDGGAAGRGRRADPGL